MVIDFGVKNQVVALSICFSKLALKRHKTDPLLSLGCIFLQESFGFLFFSVPVAHFEQESRCLFRRNLDRKAIRNLVCMVPT